jgi:Zn-finger nucleic acid-binding protein
MLEVSLSSDAGVKVDVCRHCHFVWFDAGETEKLVPKAVPPAELPIAQKARETMALFEMEQLAERAKRSDYEPLTTGPWWAEIARFFLSSK